MSFRDIIDGKKQWRAHVARINALPSDYRIVYIEIQKYFFKVGAVELTDGSLLSDLADFFERGAADHKTVTELLGTDVAAFADNLLAGYRPAIID
jgi:DNA-binding ferritin-like protein (Dps family)